MDPAAQPKAKVKAAPPTTEMSKLNIKDEVTKDEDIEVDWDGDQPMSDDDKAKDSGKGSEVKEPERPRTP